MLFWDKMYANIGPIGNKNAARHNKDHASIDNQWK